VECLEAWISRGNLKASRGYWGNQGKGWRLKLNTEATGESSVPEVATSDVSESLTPIRHNIGHFGGGEVKITSVF